MQKSVLLLMIQEACNRQKLHQSISCRDCNSVQKCPEFHGEFYEIEMSQGNLQGFQIPVKNNPIEEETKTNEKI